MQQDDESFLKNMQNLRKNVKKINKKKSAAIDDTQQDIFWTKKNKTSVDDEDKEE
jgi:hypothetical protein